MGATSTTAAHMESHGVPGRIHSSRAPRDLIGHDLFCGSHGVILI